MQYVFYVPGKPTAIAYAHDKDGEPVTGLGESLESLAKRYPGVTIGSESEFLEQAEKALRTDPVEVPAAAFHEALHMLPPLQWRCFDGEESFKCSEFYSGNVTYIYANVAGRYWKFRDVATLTHDEIIQRIIDHISAN
ncbi:hypothetical protein BKG02_004754 [Vibrio parahaemolyticus]|uniref:hypothetical protein n=1 Tax=Vibrio parahaemolyticus TaxID=670 RepID=UPI0028087E02|nr:hypothetical protein [Vibrio parahaemolyticus]EJE4644401.1 hypothetical protein [Vibrio parahaemolyticus]ELA9292945.1 hypothetical protein [Vibrio parahaemolyticus]MDS1925686.1 hypothetical protein [Vibrio parahaemolyticus]HCG8016794.1 hypothetical protein [Vibrio parahaemolyticus]